jgi:hypothetical protein
VDGFAHWSLPRKLKDTLAARHLGTRQILLIQRVVNEVHRVVVVLQCRWQWQKYSGQNDVFGRKADPSTSTVSASQISTLRW